MKITALIESDRFQVGIIAKGPIPQWDEETLDIGVSAIESGIIIATYPDLEFRKRSIPVTVLDVDEKSWKKEIAGWNFLGEYILSTNRGTIDVGCVPSICDGTSGRVVFNKGKVKVFIYGDAPREPKRLIFHFKDSRIISAMPERNRV